MLHAGPEVRVHPQHLRRAVDRAGHHLLSHQENSRVARAEDGRGRALGGLPLRRPSHQGTAEGAQVVQGREREGEAGLPSTVFPRQIVREIVYQKLIFLECFNSKSS